VACSASPPRAYLEVWIVADFPLLIQTMTGSMGGKRGATVGTKSSGLPGDPDYCGTTVLVRDS
jgi:hypothetical protein